MISTQQLNSTIKHFSSLNQAAPIGMLATEEEYDAAVELLNALLDTRAKQDSKELENLTYVLGLLISDYENLHYPVPDIEAPLVLRFFMEQHQLKQSDLPEIGSQGVVSEILAGRRELNRRQIEALSKRFGVSPAVFF